MNQDQIMSIVRSILLLFSGWAVAHGFTADTWLTVVGGIVAVVNVIWSLYAHTLTKQIDSITKSPLVKAVVVDPAIVFATDSPKVVTKVAP